MLLPLLISATLLYGHITSGWGRVGFEQEVHSSFTIITKVWNVSPAHEAGIQKGDRVVAVDDRPYSLRDPLCEIKGEIGSVVKVTILRGRGKNAQNLDFLLLRVPESEVHN